MVKSTPRSSRDRLLAAATAEFAARGFDGAKVDRIAARARINKAMLYYHFGSKAALYREILRVVFEAVAESVTAAREAGGAPDAQLRAFIRAVAGEAAARPHFPPIWLREMAEGGRHLDDSIGAAAARVLATLAAILADGRRARLFGDAHPMAVHIGVVAPLVFFAASGPVRERFGAQLTRSPALSQDAVVAYVEAATLAALERTGRPTRTKRRRT
jgi:TetR/AcrR family transcriptional regulator